MNRNNCCGGEFVDQNKEKRQNKIRNIQINTNTETHKSNKKTHKPRSVSRRHILYRFEAQADSGSGGGSSILL